MDLVIASAYMVLVVGPDPCSDRGFERFVGRLAKAQPSPRPSFFVRGRPVDSESSRSSLLEGSPVRRQIRCDVITLHGFRPMKSFNGKGCSEEPSY